MYLGVFDVLPSAYMCLTSVEGTVKYQPSQLPITEETRYFVHTVVLLMIAPCIRASVGTSNIEQSDTSKCSATTMRLRHRPPI